MNKIYSAEAPTSRAVNAGKKTCTSEPQYGLWVKPERLRHGFGVEERFERSKDGHSFSMREVISDL